MSDKKPRKLLAVDPSLRATGWALFLLDNSQPIGSGVIQPPGPSLPLEHRYESLQESVTHLLRDSGLGPNDYLVCEGPAPLVKNPRSSLKVERVRGIFESLARAAGVQVPGRLNPRTIQAELLGMRGPQRARKEVKHWAREVAERLFPDVFAADETISQDVVDALLIGSLALSKIGLAERTSEPVAAQFAEGRSRRRRGGRGVARWQEADLATFQVK